MKNITFTIIITLFITQLINAQQTITTYSTGYSSIEGIAINSNNEVFVSEHNTGKVYSIDNATGNKTEYASTGGGYANNIIFNSNDELFITEPYMDRIFIKNSAADASEYIDINIEPNSFAIDSNGNLYFSSISKVVKINSDLTLTDYASGFLYAEGIAFDSNDNLYLADRSDRKLYKILPNGTKIVIESNIENIRGVAIDPNDKVYFTKDQTYPEENFILKYDPTTNTVTDFVTSGLNAPRHIVIDNSGNMYVTDRGTETIVKINDPSLLNTTPQVVNIPDAVFKNLLLNYNPVIDINADGEIQYTEAENFSGSINVSNNNIGDLTGIEAFSNLIELNCSSNLLSDLDISQNIAIQKLICSNNQLTNLHLQNGNNPNLTDFDATGNPNLTCVFVDDANYMNTNWPNAVDATATYVENQAQCNAATQTTYVPDDNFENYLETHGKGNGIPNDDYVLTSRINRVTSLYLINQNISDLTGIEDFTALETLFCNHNQITVLDLSHNTALQNLLCSDNLLTELDVSSNYNLRELKCFDNQITTLDISQNIYLLELSCYNNQLTTLDLSQNINLQRCYCSSNQLSNIDLSQNADLMVLGIYSNQLSNLDVSHNTDLQQLLCSNNQLTTIDVSQNTALQVFDCGFNQLTALDITHNTALQSLRLYRNQLTALDVSHNTALQVFSCTYNEISSIDVSQNLALIEFECSNNNLSNLDISQNTNLEHLRCNLNQLSTLDVSQNTALQWIYCRDNQLISINMQNGNNTNLTNFFATGNPDLTCVFVDDANFMNTNWSNAIDTTANFVETQAQCDALGIDQTFKETIQIYPNPFSEYLIVKVSDNESIKNISIKNIQGQIIYQSSFVSKIKISNLLKGLYFLSIKNKNGDKAVFKLIKS